MTHRTPNLWSSLNIAERIVALAWLVLAAGFMVASFTISSWMILGTGAGVYLFACCVLTLGYKYREHDGD